MIQQKPNQLVINQLECGCPCPDARIIKGKMQIPQDIAVQYPTLQTTPLNVDIKGFNEPYNYALGLVKLFIRGKVIGADTILCEPTFCELDPGFQVYSWALVEVVATFCTF